MKKRIFLLLCAMCVSVFCLTSCGKNKVAENNAYTVDELKEIQISINTWNLNIKASSDEKAHISFDGNISDGDVKPTVLLQDGILVIVQKHDEEMQDQIALGKKGQATLYLPIHCTIPIVVNNGIGDIETDGISATELQVLNNAGYMTISNLSAENLKISSASGDIAVKNSDINSVSIVTTSGYVQLSNTTFSGSEIVTKSGEINMSGISSDTNINLQTDSGDINLTYQAAPDNLSFSVSSGSDDVTARFNGAAYDKETTSCKEGKIGEGQNKLEIKSDNGTVVVK